MIQTKVSRKQALGQNKVEGIALPSICASFLAEDFSLLPYLVGSSLFYILLFGCLFVSRQFFPAEPDRTKQIIDIEFVSAADFQNKKDLLPATIPKPSLGKKVSPPDEIILPKTSIPLEKAKPQPSKPQHREFAYAINCQQHVSADAFNLVASLPVKSKSDTEKLAIKPTKSSSIEMELEEVGPLAMTEVKDNDGDNSIELWQDGGRSNEGLGATSALANYLKELHKKLKHSWSPPSGPAHHIKVLFRLATDGSIVSLKLMSSCGDISADNSALEAVNKSAPFGKLPKDYPSRFLDLAYTFNYSTDELNEVAPSRE